MPLTCALFASKCMHARQTTSGLASLTLASRSLPFTSSWCPCPLGFPRAGSRTGCPRLPSCGADGGEERAQLCCSQNELASGGEGSTAEGNLLGALPCLTYRAQKKQSSAIFCNAFPPPCADHRSGPPALEPANRPPTHLEHCWPSLSFTAWQRGSPLSVVGCTMARGCWEACGQAVGRAVGHSVAGN